MKRFASRSPRSVEEAVDLLRPAANGDAVAAGGGSDLLGLVKDGLSSPRTLVHLGRIRGFDEIRSSSAGLILGGGVTLDELSRHAEVRARHRVLAEAARSVATPQIRNSATLAGNICQRPWCWYFRQGFDCLKRGGRMCYSVAGENQFNAIFGGGPSFIVHPSDTAPALVALGATFRTVGPDGQRAIPASRFFVLPREDVKRENVLKPGEILVSVELPGPPAGRRSTYAKVMDRQAWTHAVVSLAAALEMDGEVCRRAALVLGGVAPIPWRLPQVERMLEDRRLTAELAAEAGRRAVEGARPLSRNGYKVAMTRALVRRTLLSL